MPPKKRKAVAESTSKAKVAKKNDSKGKEKKGGASSAGSLDLSSFLKDDMWKERLKEEFEKDYFKGIEESLSADYAKGEEIFPPKDLIFNAFNLTPIDKAHGLSFSVLPGVKIPPSLKNIYKELSSDIPGFTAPDHGCLEKWAKEGVLLLNATLTVQAHKPNSHAKIGWQKFTDAAIKAVSDHTQGVVFLLWGGFAHKKEKLVDVAKHRVVKTAHPSPLSASKFKDCKCFSRVNSALKELGKEEVDWSL
ncbi:uracil-DNA glycosylase-like isoform X2 [Branchiostoma floridae x Branchiostoma japonicum]